MSTLTLSRALAAVLLLHLVTSPAEAAVFRDWQADCDETAKRCSLETAASNAAEEPDSRLTLNRGLRGPLDSVVLTLPRPGISKQHSINLRVDDNDLIRVVPGETVELLGEGQFRIEDPDTINRLLGQMRPGWRLRVEYFVGGTKPRSAFFSLSGLTAALTHPDGTPPEATPAKPAQPTAPTTPPAKPKRKSVAPDLYPPPEEDDRPVAQSVPDLPEGSRFTPAGSAPPVGDCYDHERATDDDGRFLGWISIDRC